MAARCKANTVSGDPCSAQPVRADGFCYWHSPSTAEERAEARRRGGHNKSNRQRAKRELPEAMTTPELLVTLSRVIQKAEVGLIEPGVLSSIAGAARAMNELRKSTEIEERLSELEQRAGIVGRSA